jgi:uncharacterized repeat protein (TIGR03803 family)
MRTNAVPFVALALCSTSLISAQTLTTLATFNGANGDLPCGTLIADPAGNLYGTTYYGGTYGYGTIFQVAAGTHALTTLYSFDAVDGANPQAGLTRGADGNLYGTTVGGGTSHAGTAFEFSSATHTLTTLASFNPATTGSTPVAPLTLAPDGSLYGATSFDGLNHGGTVFKIDGNTHILTTIASFGVTSSHEPLRPSTPILDEAGNPWGSTGIGGANDAGIIYEINAASHTITTVASLNANTGYSNPTPLLRDASGNLYGTAVGGVFRFDPATNGVTTIATFTGSNGLTCETEAGLVRGTGIAVGNDLRRRHHIYPRQSRPRDRFQDRPGHRHANNARVLRWVEWRRAGWRTGARS